MPLPSGYNLMSGEDINAAIDEAVAAALIVPTSDPFNAGQLWCNNGTLVLSVGPMPVLVPLFPPVVKASQDYNGPLCYVTFADTTMEAADVNVTALVTGGATFTTSVAGADGAFTVSGSIPHAELAAGHPVSVWVYSASNGQVQASLLMNYTTD